MNELVKSSLRNAFQVECYKPLLEVINRPNFLFNGVRISKLLNELLHLIHIGLCSEALWCQMTWSKLFETKFIMGMRSNYLSFWNKIVEFSNRCKKHLFISTLEILMLLSVKESNKIWNSCNSESLTAVSSYLSVHCNKNKIWIVVCLGSTFKSRLNAHTRRARWAPEIDNKTWSLFNQFLKD